MLVITVEYENVHTHAGFSPVKAMLPPIVVEVMDANVVREQRHQNTPPVQLSETELPAKSVSRRKMSALIRLAALSTVVQLGVHVTLTNVLAFRVINVLQATPEHPHTEYAGHPPSGGPMGVTALVARPDGSNEPMGCEVAYS